MYLMFEISRSVNPVAEITLSQSAAFFVAKHGRWQTLYGGSIFRFSMISLTQAKVQIRLFFCSKT